MKRQKKQWTILRILLFIIVGLFNTLLIRPEDVGTWKNYLGYALILIAAIEIIFLIIQHQKNKI